MRTIEAIKKDQDQAIFQYGAHMALAEQWKVKVLKLAEEAALLHATTKQEKEKRGTKKRTDS